MLFSTDASPSLADHLRVLYPLAQVLVGPENTDALLERTYERAAAVPPPDRPSNEREWLVRLLLDTREPPSPSDADVSPSDADSTFADDAFRRDIAEQIARNKMPVAFASCSLRERLLLAVDVLTDSSTDALVSSLDTTASEVASLRDQAHATLRASLRDVLTGPERMLVDVALPDDALRSHLRHFLTERFQPVPPAVHSKVTDILASVEPESASDAPASTRPRLLDWAASLREWMGSRQGLITLFLVTVLFVAGMGSVSFFSTESADSSSSVVDVAVRNADALDEPYAVSSSADATAYIRRTWNRQVTVPTITGAPLHGVDRVPLSDSSSVPVLLYTDTTANHYIAAYAFNYALLDQSGRRAVLDHALRTALATPDTLLPHPRPDHDVVLWRHRDDIFVAVAPALPNDSLHARIRP